jgi:hypothetical protein
MTKLLTLYSDTPGLPRFMESSKKLSAFPVPNHFDTFPGHIEKWRNINPYLFTEDYVVFTDTDDVIFQTDLPEFTADIYLAPENVLHNETIWAEQIEFYPAFSSLLDKEVFNCGTFAMKGIYLYEYQQFLLNFDDGGYRELGLEQMYFNMFVHQHKELSRVIDLSIFTPLYRNLNDGWVYKKDGIWKTNGKTIACVHSNGIKGLL